MISRTRCGVAAVVVAAIATASATAQDLYDTTVLRTINLTFDDANWETQLRDNYQSQTNILADLEMDGELYEDVGVRIRGNTSYTGLPSGSQKFSLNVEMDFVVDGQDLLGYSTLNLNNAFTDPTFCREAAYNNYVAQFMPNARANHVVVTINGENWGVYVNVQQFNKDLLRDYFDDEDGLRIKCANNPNGPGLRYVGENPSSYSVYEIKDDGGLADPYAPLIDVCDAVTNGSIANWQEIDEVFAIDPSIWSVVLENLLTDDDSYVNKGCDFVLYRNPVDGRMHLMQTDANETFKEPAWSLLRNFTSSSKPVLSHMLDAPELRRRYMAHYRTAMEGFDWSTLGAEILAMRDLIDQAVQDDPKKLYSYQNFQDNFFETVNIGGGFGGGNIIGLEEFFTERNALLGVSGELNSEPPTITNVAASASLPDPSDAVYVTAEVAPGVDPIAGVTLFYLAEAGPYQSVAMLDDGLSGDGAAGDGVYGALVPIAATSGQRVKYYVGAESDNFWGATSFEPALAETGPLEYSYSFGAIGMRITEWIYSAGSGEFVEFTNLTDAPIDMTGWSMDDDSATPGVVDLSAAGTVAPGASVVLTEAIAADFELAWNLTGVIVIGENEDANLGRNDAINLFDAGGNLVDRLQYGDEDFKGSIRTRDASGQPLAGAVGQDNVLDWVLAEAGDDYGSYESLDGDLGNPGVYVAAGSCPGNVNGDGMVDFSDLVVVLADWGATDSPADLDDSGSVDLNDLLIVLANWGDC